MKTNKSFIVTGLGLEVKEDVISKFHDAELKLIEASLAKKNTSKIKESIYQILKDNNIKFNNTEVEKVLKDLLSLSKSQKQEFSTTRKNIVSFGVDPDAFKKCGLNINCEDDEKMENIEKEIDKNDIVENDNEDINTENIEDPTSEVVHLFVLDKIEKDGLNDVIEKIKQKEIDVDISNFIYWTLRSKISMHAFITEILSDNNISKSIKPIRSIIKVIDKSIDKLTTISNSNNNDEIQEIYNKSINMIEEKLEWVLAFVVNDNELMSYIKVILLCALDSFICAEVLNIDKVKTFDEDKMKEILNGIELGIKDIFTDNKRNVYDIIKSLSNIINKESKKEENNNSLDSYMQSLKDRIENDKKMVHQKREEEEKARLNRIEKAKKEMDEINKKKKEKEEKIKEAKSDKPLQAHECLFSTLKKFSKNG